MKSTNYQFPALLAALMLTAAPSYSDPVISSASGAPTAGSTITVNGSGFGATGPKIVMFDDFEGGSAGQSVDLNAPVGQWNESKGASYSSAARTGKTGFSVYDGSRGVQRQLRVDLQGDQTEVFFSFWVRVPDGTHFPGRDVTGPGMFSSDSSWKYAWLLDDSDGYSDTSKFDMWFPAHAGRGSHNIASNDAYLLMSAGNAWWSWSSWMRMSFWVRGTSGSPTTGFFQTVSKEKGLDLLSFGSKTIFGANGSSSRFNVINFPGWLRTMDGGAPKVQPAYDDIYVAVGRGAVARVEIGDAASYGSSKNLSILPVSSWESGRVTAKVPSAGVGTATSWYLYVTDADGKTNQTGYPLECKGCPLPPTNLQIQ